MSLLPKNLLFTLVVPGTVAGYAPWLLIRGHPVDSRVNLLIAIVLFVVGSAVYLWCVWDFAIFGRGTPAPLDAPKKLVVQGLYHYTRNPMYVGVLTVIMGWVVLYQSLRLFLYAICVGTAFHLFTVFYEEPKLHELFGVEYERYCEGVPRWIRLFPTGRDGSD